MNKIKVIHNNQELKLCRYTRDTYLLKIRMLDDKDGARADKIAFSDLPTKYTLGDGTDVSSDFNGSIWQTENYGNYIGFWRKYKTDNPVDFDRYEVNVKVLKKMMKLLDLMCED
jgi:hypothetical protein